MEEKKGKKNHPKNESFLTEQLIENRVLFLHSDVKMESAQKLIKDLIALDLKEKKNIFLLLNSPGGEVTAGLAIYDVIKSLRSPVTILVTGLAASIATIILLAVKSKQRWALPHSRFLIHQPLLSGVTQGTAIDLEITAKQILNLRDLIIEIYEQETSVSKEKITQDIERDYWMTASEAKNYGLISKIVTQKAPWANSHGD